MTKLQGLLLAIFAIAATSVGFVELASAEQMQAAVLSALIAAAGMVAAMLLVVNLSAENEQSKFDCDYIGVAGIMLEESPSYSQWQEIIDRLRAIATRPTWNKLQKQNAADALSILEEAGEGLTEPTLEELAAKYA